MAIWLLSLMACFFSGCARSWGQFPEQPFLLTLQDLRVLHIDLPLRSHSYLSLVIDHRVYLLTHTLPMWKTTRHLRDLNTREMIPSTPLGQNAHVMRRVGDIRKTLEIDPRVKVCGAGSMSYFVYHGCGNIGRYFV